MNDIRKQLLSGQKKVGVWGTGYIGYSSMAYYASRGVACIGTDVSKRVADDINSGRMPVPNLEYWLGFDVEPLTRNGMIRATTDWKELISHEIALHLLAVPTEKEEKPWDGALLDVLKKLANLKSLKLDPVPLIIIESTLSPNKTDQLVIPTFESYGLKVGSDILVGVAPRRDWFISPEKSLRNLPRIIGGTTQETTAAMKEVLGIICEHLIPAKDHRHAEIVKSIENAYRHVEITLANQLSLAYPDLDMVEVLELVGTKWNVGTFHPSFGTGGYCIPLSSQYVLEGARDGSWLSILREVVRTDSVLPEIVAKSIVMRGARNVGILGLSYKGDIKVHVLSPTLKIVKTLKKGGLSVKVNDPYYSSKEIREITGAESFEFPEGLTELDCIVLVAGHRAYRAVSRATLLEYLSNCKLVLDNMEETWKQLNLVEEGIEYHVAGDPGWLPEEIVSGSLAETPARMDPESRTKGGKPSSPYSGIRGDS